MSDPLEMKCRKCRYALLVYPETRVESSHGSLASEGGGASRGCASDVWYIPEQCMPNWMSSNVEKGGWVKGKVFCPKCEARLGSYNFVSGMKCPCGSEVVAPIHIVKSKVDFFIPLEVTDNEMVTNLPLPEEMTQLMTDSKPSEDAPSNLEPTGTT